MAAAKQEKQARRKLRPGGMSAALKGLAALLALPLAGVLFPTCLLLGAGMLPTAISYLFDRSREKYLVISVAMLNFCGILPAVAELWARGQTLTAAGEALADPLAWVMAYGAGAVGWLLHVSLPPIVKVYYERATEVRLRQLTLERKALVETWGEDVKQAEDSPAAADSRSAKSDGSKPAAPKYNPAEVLGL